MIATLALLSLLGAESPNVEASAIVERPPQLGRVEAVLFFAAQVNGTFTQHDALAAVVVARVHERFAVTAMGLWNFVNRGSPFDDELINTARAGMSAPVLLQGAIISGIEVAPVLGKLTLFDETLLHFALVLNSGLGGGALRQQQKPASDCTHATGACPAAPTYSELGWRLMGEAGGGFRVQLGRYVAVRLELRDLVYGGAPSTAVLNNLGLYAGASVNF
jgi:hypothetical protein